MFDRKIKKIYLQVKKHCLRYAILKCGSDSCLQRFGGLFFESNQNGIFKVEKNIHEGTAYFAL